MKRFFVLIFIIFLIENVAVSAQSLGRRPLSLRDYFSRLILSKKVKPSHSQPNFVIFREEVEYSKTIFGSEICRESGEEAKQVAKDDFNKKLNNFKNSCQGNLFIKLPTGIARLEDVEPTEVCITKEINTYIPGRIYFDRGLMIREPGRSEKRTFYCCSYQQTPICVVSKIMGA